MLVNSNLSIFYSIFLRTVPSLPLIAFWADFCSGWLTSFELPSSLSRAKGQGKHALVCNQELRSCHLPSSLPVDGRTPAGQDVLKNGRLTAQEMMRMPKFFFSCSRKMKVSTVCGTKRMPAGTRPWRGDGDGQEAMNTSAGDSWKKPRLNETQWETSGGIKVGPVKHESPSWHHNGITSVAMWYFSSVHSLKSEAETFFSGFRFIARLETRDYY